MNKVIFFFFICCCGMLACKSYINPASLAITKDYIDEVVYILQNNSVNKRNINWEVFTNEMYASTKNLKTLKEAYPFVSEAAANLGDRHSYFVAATDNFAEEAELPPSPTAVTVPSGIGYINVPFCIGGEAEEYIRSITGKITAQNNEELYGWVIDLRGNFGGNMWPMFLSIGSFLQNGTQGYFVNADDQMKEWNYEDGKVLLDSVLILQSGKPVKLKNGTRKLAVLTDHQTASSGEAIAVILKGLPHVRSFGEKTYGVSTGCESFTLSDGSRLNLATSVFADRNRKTYGSFIIPDIECKPEEALEKAIEWIHHN